MTRIHLPETVERNKTSARRHYDNNKEACLARCKAAARDRRDRLFEYKLGLECADCPPGTKHHPFQLDFDHRPGADKVDNVSAMAGRASWKRMMEEIDKCDVVCANCHRRRTWNQQNPGREF